MPSTNARPPKLFLRGDTYYIKRNVPRELQTSLGCAQVWRSLKTSDASRAVVRAQAEYAQIELHFAQARVKLEAFADLDMVEALTAERREYGTRGAVELLRAHHIPALLQRYRAITLACDDDERRALGSTPASERREALLERKALLEEARLQLRDAVIAHDESVMRDTAETLARAERLVPRRNSPALRKLSAELLPLDLRLVEEQLARLEGRAEPSPPVPQAVRETPTLEHLVQFWSVHAAPRLQTVKDVKAVVRDFEKYFGQLPVPQITKAQALKYRDILIARGQARKTIEKKLKLLNAVVNAARKEAKVAVTVSPFAEVTVWHTKVKQHSVKRRQPFSIEQLNRFFASPIYASAYRPKGAKEGAGFFMPILALFTGCREEELAQLRVDDVFKIQGTWVLRVCDYAEAQQVKTTAAIRIIPVHRVPIECGFIDYVECLRVTQEERVFPLLKPGCRGQYSDAFSKFFNRYLDIKVGIKENSFDFHSFRHNFRNQLRICGVEEEVADALMGHSGSGKSEGRRYGTHSYPLAPLVAALEKVDFKGLKLSGTQWTSQ